MSKDIIEFPYETRKEHIKGVDSFTEFNLHYFYYENYLEKDVYKLCLNDKEKFIGYVFSVERLHSNNIQMTNDRNQKNFEAYMDAAREVFFERERKNIKSYITDLNLDEKVDKVRIDDILKYKAFLKSNHGQFTTIDMFETYKSERDFSLVIFIEDLADSESYGFVYEHMKVLMMLKYHLFLIEDTDEFYNSKKNLELNNIIDENDEIETELIDYELKYYLINSISNIIEDNDLRFMTQVLPDFYYQSYNIEYLKFSILYQYIEIFIGLLAHKLLDKAMDDKQGKNIVNLKSHINSILTERFRIQKLFTTYSEDLKPEIKASFDYKYRKFLENIELNEPLYQEEEDGNGKQDVKVYDKLYHLRNILYHNLRAFNNKDSVEDNLKVLNLDFEKIIVNILTTFKIPDCKS